MVVSTNADLAGAPSHVRDLVQTLRGRYRFTVVFGEAGPIEKTLQAAGVTTRILPGLRSAINPAGDLRAVLALRRLIREFRPQILHAHSSKAGLLTRIAGALASIPVVYTIHGWGFGPGRPRLQSLIVRSTEKWFAGLIARYIAVSQADADIGIQALGLDARRIDVIPNAVGESTERAHPDRHAGFIMVARTDYAKDHETALRAYGSLGLDNPFSCVGGGTDDPAFAARVAQWAGAGASTVRLLGARADIPSLLAESGVFVLSSRYEGMPLSIIEAMRSGLPVIASRVGGVAELVEDGRTGILVEPGDIEDMKSAMRRLALDPGLRRAMGEAGRARFQSGFSLDRMRTRIEAVYDRVLLNDGPVTAATA